MMIGAGFSQQDKRKFWCEVISTATKLDNIMVRKERTKPPYTLFYTDESKYKKLRNGCDSYKRWKENEIKIGYYRQNWNICWLC